MPQKVQIKTLEHRHSDENKIIDDIIRILRKSLKKDYGRKQKMERRLHTKSHGLLAAEFTVEKNLPQPLQVGLFRVPKTFKSWVRFSNGSPNVSEDYEKGVRGMSIKILEVNEKPLEFDNFGYTQDILLTNNKIVFPGTVEMQKRAMQVLFVSKLYFIQLLLSFKLKGLITFLQGQIKIASVLEQTYFSGTPYLFGKDQAIKWNVNPLITEGKLMPVNPGKDFLRENLAEDLAKRDYYFDLCVQLQKNPESEPIENSAIEWMTPFIKVGTIRILKQDFNATKRIELEERITFSPWHSIVEHQPLGGINRIRREVYKALSDYRFQHNTAKTQK